MVFVKGKRDSESITVQRTPAVSVIFNQNHERNEWESLTSAVIPVSQQQGQVQAVLEKIPRCLFS